MNIKIQLYNYYPKTRYNLFYNIYIFTCVTPGVLQVKNIQQRIFITDI